jgi:hypothetical protein
MGYPAGIQRCQAGHLFRLAPAAVPLAGHQVAAARAAVTRPPTGMTEEAPACALGVPQTPFFCAAGNCAAGGGFSNGGRSGHGW